MIQTSRIVAFALALLLLQGCASTHMVSMKYSPTPAASTSVAGVDSGIGVGSFQDKRDTDARWLGAIRGGYGNVLKRLMTNEPTSDEVRKSFMDALQARSIPLSNESAAVLIEGEILKLDCSYFFNREAHAHLLIRVVSPANKAVLYTQSYRTDNKESGVGAGIFGNVEHLAEFQRKTVNETVDKVFADPAFINALRGSTGN